jgi:hypothetical protein
VTGVEAIIAQKLRLQGLEPDISAIRAGNSQGIPISSAAKDIVFYIFGSQNLADANTNFARTANTAGGVDLNYLHPTFSQKK